MEKTIQGKLPFGAAAETFKARLMDDKSLKPRSKSYRLERLQALLRSWPNLEGLDFGKIKKHDCQ